MATGIARERAQELPTEQEAIEKDYSNGDPLDLQGSDHPGMMLLTSPLTGKNYLSWSRSIKIALGAKLKLGFIDGKCEKPAEISSKFDQWIRVDCMVRSWILNSISKEIVDAFIYTTSARDLWIELEERYGECNGPLLYQLQREISSSTQGSLSIEKYFTKLKKLWDEIACLMPIPICSCGAAKEVSDLASFNKLMQFLMGLNDTYDNIRNQLLVMEPLPSVNRAYSMVLRVEKQREIHVLYPEATDNIAMMASANNHRSSGYFRGRGGWIGRSNTGRGNTTYGRGSNKRFNNFDREMSFCEHCHANGHSKEGCFKLIGYPDWYKGLKEQRVKEFGGRAMANNVMNMSDSPLDLEGNGAVITQQSEASTGNITDIVQQELKKMLRGKMLIDNGNQINFAHLNDYSGPEG